MSSSRHQLFIGIATTAASLLTAWLMYLHPEKLRAPPWVGYAACAVLFMAGVAVIARARGSARTVDALASAILGGMLLITGWLAVGPGARRCVASLPGLRGIPSDWLCRGAFGLGALILAAMLALALRRLRVGRRQEG